MGWALLMGTNSPRSCSCATRLLQHSTLLLYQDSSVFVQKELFLFLDSNYYLVRQAVGSEMAWPVWTYFICFNQQPTTSKHSNVHTPDFIVARVFHPVICSNSLSSPYSVPCFLATSASHSSLLCFTSALSQLNVYHHASLFWHPYYYYDTHASFLRN